jgi:preprotein translocase subunit SecD/SecD/SecF fusion protein
MSVILSASPPKGKTLTNDMLQQATTILSSRVDKLGVSEASIQRQGANNFLIQLPGIKTGEQVLQTIGRTGVLEFKPVIGEDSKGKPKLGPTAVTGDTLTSATTGFDQFNKPQVELAFNAEGREKFARITTQLAKTGGQLAIVLDGTVKSAPTVKDAITDGRAVIENMGSVQDAQNLAIVLQTGALPVNLQLAESRFVGPTLGQDSLRQGLYAVIAGLALVALYLLFYYRGFGFVAWAGLAVFGALFLGVLSVIGTNFHLFALTLPGIAGMALSIAVAADTSILVLERVKEEVGEGRTLRTAAQSGFLHAIGTSINADLVTFIGVIFLWIFAIGPVKGFAFTLILGIILDLLTAVFFTKPAVALLSEWKAFRSPAFSGVKGAK